MNDKTKMSQLSAIHRQFPIIVLMVGDKPMVIDGSKVAFKNPAYNGQDVALLFSSTQKALKYRDNYPSLQDANPVPSTVNYLVSKVFRGKVEYFALDLD
jgi:hypothetical protein